MAKWFLAGGLVVLLLGGAFWFMQRQLRHERAARVHAELQLKEMLGHVATEIPERDTVFVHDTATTARFADGTRVASTSDSGFAGVVSVTATAPPWPDPLGIRVGIRRPAFTPSVGLVELGDSVIAVVGWQGEQVKIGTGYHRPKTPKAPRAALLSAFVDGRYVNGQEMRAAAGLTAGVRAWSVFGGVEQKIPFGGTPRSAWFVGAQRHFRIF